MDYALEEFKKKEQITIPEGHDLHAIRHRVRNRVVKAKTMLEDKSFMIKEEKLHEGLNMEVELKKEKLDGKIQQLYDKTEMQIDFVLQKS